MPPTAPARDIYTVSRLNQEVSRLLSGSFGLLWLEGEISNLAQPRSGHLYFSVKDPGSQVRAAMFRNRNMLLRFKPADGMQVLMRVRVALYEPRGDYQLVVEHMEPAGDGALRRAFEMLKEKLFAEGLFSDERKRPLPAIPRRLGVITSPTGAAIRDVLTVLRRRWPALPVLIYPVAVQGASAAGEMIDALRLAEQRGDCDVLLLTRGGGSLEDLQAFNSEALARAIAACRIPVVCGVGHEVDITIADYVADLRAATPSAAAELISPDRSQQLQQLRQLRLAMQRYIQLQLKNAGLRIIAANRQLQRLHPQQRLQLQQQRLDELEMRLQRAVRDALRGRHLQLAQQRTQLSALSPRNRLAQAALGIRHLQQRLRRALLQQLAARRNRTAAVLQHLHAVSPLATLQRGYAVALRRSDGSAVTDAASVQHGDKLDLRLARGTLGVVVDKP